jgi:hypothetical protein
MNRKAYASIRLISPASISLALIFLALIFLPSCGSVSSAPAESIAATSGTPQSATVSTAFGAPLVATVTKGGSPMSGALVTFTAPATGASGTFAGGVNTATTNASGVATSAVFTANGTAGAYMVTVSVTGTTMTAGFSVTNTAVVAASVAAASGTPQSATVSTAFGAPLVATVLASNASPVSGVVVTFTAPATGASGTFASNSNATETDTTDASGVATSSTFTANGTTGVYTVTATVSGVLTPANFGLTNMAAIPSNHWSFYLSGQEAIGKGKMYVLAGSVAIDANSNIVGGEQDYNDGDGLTSPQPSGDTITGGTITYQPNNLSILTLTTSNKALGVNGVETLGVTFVNPGHGLIVQFDGSATSSGTLDLQSLQNPLGGSYAFTLSGLDPGLLSIVVGGVFSINGTVMQGVFDFDDFGTASTPTLGAPFSGTISAPDPSGRGTITGTGIAATLNYYIVNSEAMRIIDVDAGDTGVGSAFSQGEGAGNFGNQSLGASVFGMQSNPGSGAVYAAAGQFTTNPDAGTFSGFANDNEINGLPTLGIISGNYSIASNGRGSLTIGTGMLGDVSVLGIYMTDPNLNLIDPNNPSGGGGGALVAELDGLTLNGIGVMIQQTDTETDHFQGEYAFGAQYFQLEEGRAVESDFVGEGSMREGDFTGNGLLSDPSDTFGGGQADTGVTFSGTATPDPNNPGRYEMYSGSSLDMTLADDRSRAFGVVIYQANGGQLFWVGINVSNTLFGSLETEFLGGPRAAKKAAAKTKPKPKR